MKQIGGVKKEERPIAGERALRHFKNKFEPQN